MLAQQNSTEADAAALPKPASSALRTFFTKAFNLTVLQKARWPWIDYLKGIAIVLVVYRHVLIGIDYSGIPIPSALEQANMIFYSFRMPLFFILSGIFISRSLAKRSLKELVFIKFENLFYPYLVWAFLQVSLQIVLSNFTNSTRGLQDYLYILYHPQMLDQFWYLPALFNTTLIFLAISSRLKPPYWVHLLLGLIFFFTAHYFERVSMMSDWMKFYFFFALGDSISRVFFQERVQAFLKSRWSLLAFIPVFVVAQLYYLNYQTNAVEFLAVALVGCITMFMLAFRFERWKLLPFLRVLGYHSLYIYVMHVIVAAFTRTVLAKVLGVQNPVVLLLAGITFGVLVPVMVYNLFINGQAGWFLFSFSKKKKEAAA